MAESNRAQVPVEHKAQLVEYIEQGCRQPEDWRIGTEHEKFGYKLDDLHPLAYEGPQGILEVLKGLMRFGWEPMYEGETIIGLILDGASVTLEPGGQFELSGAELDNLHQTCDEVHAHLAQVREVAGELNVGFMGLGFQPKWALDEMPVMPKGRYSIMRRYMPTRGTLGLDMMFRSCTVQTNLDFCSGADMVKKFRVALALQPIATALFANSPFTEGEPNGFLSYRSHLWTDTDADRCGTLPFVFEESMGFERYVDYALDVPMYFVYRDGYLDAAGQSFRDFLDGKLPALPGEKPSLQDWEDHLSTIFPEVRLKKFLEMRGADGGPWRRLCALPALWVGLLYHDDCLDAAWDMVKDWSEEEHTALRRDVPRAALATKFRNETVLDLAHRALDIARKGLHHRNRLDPFGNDECHFLSVLEVIVEEGRTPAEDLLEAYTTRWNGSVDPIFAEQSY